MARLLIHQLLIGSVDDFLKRLYAVLCLEEEEKVVLGLSEVILDLQKALRQQSDWN